MESGLRATDDGGEGLLGVRGFAGLESGLRATGDGGE